MRARRLPEGWTPPRFLELYRLMLLTRALNDRQFILTRQGEQGIHLSARGHEASSAASALALDPTQDVLVPSHRSLAAVLAWGVTPHEVLLQCLSRAEDPAGGGRSMPNHYASAAGRVISMSSPIATQLPHATGAALADSIRGESRVTLVFFGDGASSKADFHEALNFAAIRRLPVVFVCENNGWSISVPVSKQMAVPSVVLRARGYGMPGVSVDGVDPFAVHGCVGKAAARARTGDGPTLVEVPVARLAPHSSDDDDTRYRSAEERAEAERRDPLPLFEQRLRGFGVLDTALRDSLRAEAKMVVDEALAPGTSSAPWGSRHDPSPRLSQWPWRPPL
jgi:2-oxoisovalerate dehydrogenase E1 component alpha subunit